MINKVESNNSYSTANEMVFNKTVKGILYCYL